MTPKGTRLNKCLKFTVGSVEIKIKRDSKIYMPSVATLTLAKNLRNVDEARVLDLGTGSGFLAILASKLGAKHIVAVDISPRAIRAAKENAIINEVKNIEFKIGDIYHPVENDVFDLIICNPPMTPSRDPLPRFTWGGVDGRRVLDEAIKGAPNHLRKNGRLLIPAVSLVGIGKTNAFLRKVGLKPRVLDYCIYPFGKTLLKIMGYINQLAEAEYVYDLFGRPCWRLVVFEAIKT